jgi:hypothetical protein
VERKRVRDRSCKCKNGGKCEKGKKKGKHSPRVGLFVVIDQKYMFAFV